MKIIQNECNRLETLEGSSSFQGKVSLSAVCLGVFMHMTYQLLKKAFLLLFEISSYLRASG